VVGVLVAETIHPECMCEGGGRGGEEGGRAFYYTYIYRGDVCLFITAGPSTKMFIYIMGYGCVCVCLLLQDLLQSCARWGGGEWRTCAMRYDEPCVFITAGPSTKMFTWGGGRIWEDMGLHVTPAHLFFFLLAV
jgi:hypothetical protein